MLQDMDRTIEKLLTGQGKINPRDIDISFEQPTGEWSARLSRPTLDCWCFDLRENLKLRNMERRIEQNGRHSKTGLPARRIDLAYLVTAWARKIEDEHQLLWRALSVFKQFLALPPSMCEGNLRYQTTDIPLLVADMSNGPVNLVDLWGVMDNQMRLGFVLVATVELDIELSIEAPLVLEATIRTGQAENPLDRVLTDQSSEIKIVPKESDQT